jgi:hypothetical protein
MVLFPHPTSQIDLTFFRYTGFILVCLTLVSGALLIFFTIKESNDIQLAQSSKTQTPIPIVTSSFMLQSHMPSP